MSSVVAQASERRPNSASTLWFDLIFGLLPLVLAAPMLSVEFQLLWSRPSMRYFSAPFFVVAVLVVRNFGSQRAELPRRVLWARTIFLLGVVVFGLSVWRNSPWGVHLSYICLFTGWAMERFGSVAWPSLLGWSALLITSMRLPGEWSVHVQEWLVNQASIILSHILDGVAIPFLIQADTFSMRNSEFSLRDCCGGPYSIHALASLVVLMLLFGRRSLFAALVLLLTLPCWQIVQNVLLLLAVVLLQHFGNRDATQGVDHIVVQLAAFSIVAICCWVTSWFLARMVQPVPAVDSQFEPEFLLLNSVLCWPQPDPFAEDANVDVKSKRMEEAVWVIASSQALRRLSWVAAVAMVTFGGISTRRWAYGDSVRTHATAEPAFNEATFNQHQWKETFPATFGRWRQIVTAHGTKVENGVPRGWVDWQFDWQGQVLQLQITFPYTLRPRFAEQYEAKGWKVLSQEFKQLAAKNVATASDDQPANPEPVTHQDWTIIHLENELGGRATVIVAYHKIDSKPQVTDQPSLVATATEYQIVLFCESGDELTQPQLLEMYNHFLQVNALLQNAVAPSLHELLGDENGH